MKKKALNTTIVLTMLFGSLTACGETNKEGSRWSYTREEMSTFVNVPGKIIKGAEGVSTYTIDVGEDIFNDTFSADDLIVFNNDKAKEEMINANKKYFDYETISKASTSIINFESVDKSEFNIDFNNTDSTLNYSILIHKDALDIDNYMIVENREAVEQFNEIAPVDIKEREYIEAPYEESTSINFYYEIVKNIGIAVIGGVTDSPVSVFSGIVGLLQTLSGAFRTEATIGDVVRMLLETQVKIDNLSDKLDRNTKELSDAIVATQAAVNTGILETLNTQINDFANNSVSKIEAFNRSYANQVANAYKKIVNSDSYNVKMCVTKNSDGKYEAKPFGMLKDSDVNLIVNISDFSNSKKFLEDHLQIVEKGFTEEFDKDIANAVNKCSSVPSDLDKDICIEFVKGMIADAMAKEYYSDPANLPKAQEYRDLMINYCERITGSAGGKSILSTFIDRLGLMYNFFSEVKAQITSFCANVLYRLQTNVARASQALMFAQQSSEDLRNAFLQAQTLIKQTHHDALASSNRYSFTTNCEISSSFVNFGYNTYYTNRGNDCVLHADEYFNLIEVSPLTGKVTVTPDALSNHNCLSNVEHARIATRFNLLKGYIEDLRSKDYITYLLDNAIIQIQTYCAYTNNGSPYETDYDNGYRFLTSDIENVALTSSDTNYSMMCQANGVPASSYDFRVNTWYNYGSKYDSKNWSGRYFKGYIVDGKTGSADYKDLCGYARYDESHFYWLDDEHWSFVSWPQGYYAFTLDKLA